MFCIIMKTAENFSGLLLIDKPHGWTSADCVNRVRRTLEDGLRAGGFSSGGFPGKHLKVGHFGTLDPFATGLLVLGIGKATKAMNIMSDCDKEYVFEIVFGLKTSTFDLDVSEDDVFFAPEPEGGWQRISDESLKKTLDEFRGEISQKPPIFSALKINGKRAYRLARAGKDFEIDSRMVRVDALEVLENSLKEISVFRRTFLLPVVKLFATVSKGTYIRSLAVDIGANLDMPATVLSLCRTRVGEFALYGDLPVVKLSKETTFAQLFSCITTDGFAI